MESEPLQLTHPYAFHVGALKNSPVKERRPGLTELAMRHILKEPCALAKRWVLLQVKPARLRLHRWGEKRAIRHPGATPR